ncbi:MAG TPA: STAS domain-containing protein [Thermoanaerobaculia bacterium]|jgi:anti-sigma B factor antagonist
MKISEEERGPHTILHVAGTLALGDSTRALQEYFEKIASEKTGAVLLDLSDLEHLDSTAVGVLVGGLKRFEAQGRRFYLVNPRERVASVFRITNLDSVFRVFPTVEAAMTSVNLASEEEETSEH